jgi:hypothetical protein
VSTARQSLSNGNALIIFLLAASLHPLLAQEKTRFAIETDPATFAFSGYALHARLQPAGLANWNFGAGVYAMDFPDLFVDINSANRDKGWTVRLNQGFGLFTEYHFRGRESGWLLGGQVALQEYKIENGEVSSASSTYRNALLMAYGGYRWYLFGENFYVQPWGGLGYTWKVDGDNSLAGETYEVAPLVPFMTVHIGYAF